MMLILKCTVRNALLTVMHCHACTDSVELSYR